MRRLFFRGYESGLSNARMSLEIGVGLAHLGGRALVPYNFRLPARFSPVLLQQGRDLRHCSSIFDLFDVPLPCTLDYVHDPQVHVPGALRCPWEHVFNSVFYFPAELPIWDGRFQDFRNHRPHAHTFDEGLRSAADLVLDVQTLGFYSHYFYLAPQRRRELIDLMRRVQPKAPYLEMADRLAAHLGPFNAIHLRRGDFLSFSFTPRCKQVSGDEIMSNIEPLIDRRERLLICTDSSRDQEFFAPILRHYRDAVFLDRYLLDSPQWFEQFLRLPHNDDSVLALLTQLVAGRARVFAGTMYSTFTAMIQRQRGLDGRDPRFLFCYNDFGPVVDFQDGEFRPQRNGSFTWNRVRYPVEPLVYSWMREWPESFEPDPSRPQHVVPSPGNSRYLLAASATIHGQTARYEAGGGRDNIGYWTNPADYVTWDLDVPEALHAHVEICYACAPHCSGTRFRVAIEGAPAAGTIDGVVHSTGSWSAFTRWISLGELRIAAGPQRLSVRVTEMPALAAMNLHGVRLVPLAGRRRNSRGKTVYNQGGT